MPPEKFPCCVLNLHINPAAVDVNVHPAKLEVKFSNEKPVFEAIYYAVRNALEQDKQRPDIKLNQGHISVEEARRLLAETPPTHKPRISDATVPIREGKAESLGRQQIKMEIPAAPMSRQEPVRPAPEASHVRESTQTTAPKPFRATLPIGESDGIQIPKMSAEKPLPLSVHPVDKSAVVQPTVSVSPTPPAPVPPPSKPLIAKPQTATPQEMLDRYLKDYEEGKIITAENTGAENAPPPPQNDEALTEVPKDIKPQDKAEPPHYRIIGEVWNAYILLEYEDKLLLIDQHAAHERIIFEQFKAAMQEHEPLSQMLMIPVAFEFTAGDVQIIADFRSEIEAIGFVYDIEDKMICVHGIPCGVEITAVEDMFATIAERIRTETGSAQLTRDILFEKALYQASCKAAIKAGRAYASEHIEWICDKLMRIPDITVCPHGRPVAMTLSRANLDRQFKRS